MLKFFRLCVLAFCSAFSACAVIPRDLDYAGPQPRPDSILDYYAYDAAEPYNSVAEQLVTEKEHYVHKRILLGTDYGGMTIEYYQRRELTENLIFVFPILGGKNSVEGYFAKYFANHGFNTAIVHRDRDFKRPELFDEIEQIFRRNVIRDRIAMDYFERVEGIWHFGSFGISRGAINAALTAGVDARLTHNVLAMGGSHLVEVFRRSDVGGIRKYRDRVMEEKKITADQFYAAMEREVRTDPKNLAQYIDAKDTLMFLSVFDKSVPFRYGLQLRSELGTPKTVFLVSGHATSLLYTGFLNFLPPGETLSIFPFDFVESESLRFYNDVFKTGRIDFWHLPFIILQLPFEFLGRLYFTIF